MVGRTTRKTTKGTRVKSSAKRLKEQTPVGAPDVGNKRNLLREYESFSRTLDSEMLRTAALKQEELKQLDSQEEEFFHRQCNQFTMEQLDMTCSEMEDFLKTQEAKEPQVMPEGHVADHVVPSSELPVAIKIPLRHRKRKSGLKMQYRRPSITTPHFAVNRPAPKFMTTGIKNTQPRPGRIGELVYSENGSPVIVPDSKKLRLALRKGENFPVADEV
ncbi:hypothetical protein RvY_07404 [Ramazzottius varieornatus]|uniref:Uncharacterized protein n=1 Tax=Ramazzottius varieornatus TaxID=947166 RepID=A0A1D1VAH4_RAMVA|nr:hypothetical protein RvY_07404 [Ramazzottius varieornatus]